jgi:enoyl-CoA hydratase
MSATAMTEDDDILFDRQGALGVVTLNRPRALNALTLDMIRRFEPRLAEWAADDGIAAVLVRGTGERAFCAGGDIRAIWESCRGDGRLARDFFREEYRLDRRVFTFPKPYVALIDGVTMGGGVGVSIHGSHRVATERTVFAMPETGIGLFPDVGAGYALPRLPGALGLYLGLTGRRLGAADCLYAGIATHYVESAHLDQLRGALAEVVASELPAAMVERVLDLFSADPGVSELLSEQGAVDRCFGQDSLEGIFAALEAEDSAWAADTLAALARCSPTSLKIAFRQIRRGAGLDFESAMKMEFRLSQACVAGHDFPEGIRAAVIDKDNKPDWQPARLEEVSEALIDRHFGPQEAPDLTFD